MPRGSDSTCPPQEQSLACADIYFSPSRSPSRLSSVSLQDGEMFISRVFLPCGEGIIICVMCTWADGLRNQSERSPRRRSRYHVAVKSIVSCFLGIWFDEITLGLVDKWQRWSSLSSRSGWLFRGTCFLREWRLYIDVCVYLYVCIIPYTVILRYYLMDIL